MKVRSLPLKLIVIASICVIVGAGIGLLCYYLLSKPEVIPYAEIEPTIEMVEKVIYYENGEQRVIDLESEEGAGIANLLARTLHRLNTVCECIWNEEQIQEIREKDRCIESVFRRPIDVTIERTSGKQYVLEDIKNALFILEDNLNEGLGAHVLVGREFEGDTSYGGWSIIKGRDKRDKSWVNSLDRMISELH